MEFSLSIKNIKLNMDIEDVIVDKGEELEELEIMVPMEFQVPGNETVFNSFIKVSYKAERVGIITPFIYLILDDDDLKNNWEWDLAGLPYHIDRCKGLFWDIAGMAGYSKGDFNN